MIAIVDFRRTKKASDFKTKALPCGIMQQFPLQVQKCLKFSVCFFLAIAGNTESASAYTKSSLFAVFGHWKFTSESGGGYWCRATGQIGDFEIQILAGDLIPSYAPFTVVVRTPKKTKQFLPVNFRTGAKIFIDGEYFAAGDLISSGDVIGGKSSAHYARATFAKINDGIAKLQKANKLTLVAEDEVIAPFEVTMLDMDKVMGLLRNCQATRGKKI